MAQTKREAKQQLRHLGQLASLRLELLEPDKRLGWILDGVDLSTADAKALKQHLLDFFVDAGPEQRRSIPATHPEFKEAIVAMLFSEAEAATADPATVSGEPVGARARRERKAA